MVKMRLEDRIRGDGTSKIWIRSQHGETPLQRKMRNATYRSWFASYKVWLATLSLLLMVGVAIYYTASTSSQSFHTSTSLLMKLNRPENLSGTSRLAWWRTSLSDSFLASRSDETRSQDADSLRQIDAGDDGEAEPQYTYKNPTVYGWAPAFYPNPLENPVRCAISHLQPIGSSTTSRHDLRLCDPDWVLGGLYLEKISNALYNFTEIFGNGEPAVVPEASRPWDVSVDPSMRPRLHGVAKVQNSQSKAAEKITKNGKSVPIVELAVATVRKMDISAVLREGTYYAYENEEDLVNDAAQVFARSLHDRWWSTRGEGRESNQEQDNSHGLLIFLSVQDHVCFISTRSSISSILPWWRLDHIVANMKPALKRRDFGGAILHAISDLAELLKSGPPTWSDRLNDFVARFGVVMAFAIFTFFFGAWGEYRDRRKRWRYAEERSQLNVAEQEKARQLQRVYMTKVCPICLEAFPSKGENPYMKSGDVLKCVDELKTASGFLRRVDSIGMPLYGADGKKIKLLRCGHIFCESCWKAWVHSGCGNPCNCPMCRQDVGKVPNRKRRRCLVESGDSNRQNQSTALPENGIVSNSTNNIDGGNNLPRETVVPVSNAAANETSPLLGSIESRNYTLSTSVDF